MTGLSGTRRLLPGTSRRALSGWAGPQVKVFRKRQMATDRAPSSTRPPPCRAPSNGSRCWTPSGISCRSCAAPAGGVRFQTELATGDGATLLDRMTLTMEAEGRVHQVIEISRDHGATWETAALARNDEWHFRVMDSHNFMTKNASWRACAVNSMWICRVFASYIHRSSHRSSPRSPVSIAMCDSSRRVLSPATSIRRPVPNSLRHLCTAD